MSSQKDPLWIEAHDQLKLSMQKEISLMREILANMHQEELSLLVNDKGSWNKVMQERAQMIERLSDLRSQRVSVTQKIEKMVAPHHEGHPLTLDQILPSTEEISCEILSLRDQLMALIERMNLQNCRNEHLFYHVEHLPPGSQGLHHSLPPSPERPKRKATVTTYQIKR